MLLSIWLIFGNLVLLCEISCKVSTEAHLASVESEITSVNIDSTTKCSSCRRRITTGRFILVDISSKKKFSGNVVSHVVMLAAHLKGKEEIS